MATNGSKGEWQQLTAQRAPSQGVDDREAGLPGRVRVCFVGQGVRLVNG
jgi:hypothetical protein